MSWSCLGHVLVFGVPTPRQRHRTCRSSGRSSGRAAAGLLRPSGCPGLPGHRAAGRNGEDGEITASVPAERCGVGTAEREVWCFWLAELFSFEVILFILKMGVKYLEVLLICY